MSIVTDNILSYENCRNKFYNTFAQVIHESTALPIVVENTNTNRPTVPFASLSITKMQPLSYNTIAGTIEIDGVVHEVEYIFWTMDMKINTWKTRANDYMGVIRASLRSKKYKDFIISKGIGLTVESNIDNNSTVLSTDFEERAQFVVSFNAYITNVISDEQNWIESVDLNAKYFLLPDKSIQVDDTDYVELSNNIYSQTYKLLHEDLPEGGESTWNNEWDN